MPPRTSALPAQTAWEPDDVALICDSSDTLLPVLVRPQGRANEVGGVHNGALRVTVTAPPAEGAANAAVLQVLAKALRLPKSALSVARGRRSREKTIRLSGYSIVAIRARLAALPPE